MANINLFIFIGLGIILGGTFIVSCLYVMCKFCSDYLYNDPLGAKHQQSAECENLAAEKIPVEDTCEHV